MRVRHVEISCEPNGVFEISDTVRNTARRVGRRVVEYTTIYAYVSVARVELSCARDTRTSTFVFGVNHLEVPSI